MEINKQPVIQGQQVPGQQAPQQQVPLQQVMQEPVPQAPIQQPTQQPVPEVIQQQPMGQQVGQVPSTPIPSTTPELEQVLVKIQELEQRIGEQEMENANQVPTQDEGKFEKLRTKKEEIAGHPELEKERKPDKEIGPEGTNEVPKAQTSEIHDEDGGTKTGAPVSGEETGLDKGKPSENDAIAKVPQPKKQLPKLPIIKNALEGADGGVPVPGTPSKKPEEMEDENGNKVPKSQSPDGLQEQYNHIKEKLSGRKSTVGAFGGSRVESLESVKNDADTVIKEYLQKSKIRI